MKRLAPLLLALAAAVVIHAPALRAPFFADDYLFLDQVRARSLPAALAAPDPIGNFYRPLGRQLHFWWLAHATGESPLAFHVANLLLLLATIAMLWALARRVAGPAAAGIAAAVFALSHAADVPVLWASGSQDLLAATLATGALLAFVHARRLPAAGLLLAASFAKETVALAPFVAVLLAREPRETWTASIRRAWPLFAAVAAWAAVAIAAGLRRAAPGAGLVLDPLGVPASLVQLGRTVLGLEWRAGAAPFSPWVPPTPGVLGAVLACAAAAALAARAAGAGAPHTARGAQREGRRRGTGSRIAPVAPGARRPIVAGVLWAAAGALPVAAVASIWSAYYFLFAMEGVALALGVALSRRPVLAPAVVLLAGFAAQQARGLDEFASGPSAWSAQSHVNRRYLDRGMGFVARGVEQLREQVPAVAPRTTFFFANLPPSVGWQVGDGPLVRWVYRDTSVRSFFAGDVTLERVRRGPARFVTYRVSDDRLVDRTDDTLLYVAFATGAVLDQRPVALRAFLALEQDRRPDLRRTSAIEAILALEQGDTAAAWPAFARAGQRPARGGEAGVNAALARLAAGDTAGALALALATRDAYALDPSTRALAADLLVRDPRRGDQAIVEAWAARVLAPEWPDAWRRWGAIQYVFNRFVEADRSLSRYFALDPAAATNDPATVQLHREVRARLPGGKVTQRTLRDDLSR